MSRKTVALTVDVLAELPGPSRSCLFWELDPVRRAEVRAAGVSRAGAEKEAWLSEVLREWGSCGRGVVLDERPVGYVVYVPAAFAAGAAGLPTAPVSQDAVLMTMAWVHPAHRGGGLSRLLVQGMARDLATRGNIVAVEAFGHAYTRRGGGAECPDRCVVPAEWLARVGFKTQRAHGTTPRMRMDLRTTLRWRDEVEAALDRLVGVVRPVPKVRPQDGALPREEARPS